MVWQLVYISKMTTGVTSTDFERILDSCRRNNPPLELTGMLLQGRNLFLQVLEGPENSVETAFNRIASDWRHFDVRVLSRSEVDARSFPAWTMGFAKADQFAGIAGVNDFLHGDDPDRWFTDHPSDALGLLQNFRKALAAGG